MRIVKTKAGTELPLMNLKGKDYLLVAYRIVWFREEHPDWRIETEFLVLNENAAIARAKILNADGVVIAMSTKSETPKGFGDFIEKAETGAIGRALALCGYGTQFTDDLDEGDRLADAPILNTQNGTPKNVSRQPVQSATNQPVQQPVRFGNPRTQT